LAAHRYVRGTQPLIQEEIQLSTATRENPLSSAQVRIARRVSPASAGPGPEDTRPFGLRNAQPVPTPVSPHLAYCPVRQLAIGDDGRPLAETMKKEWKTKSSTDGDEGPEEDWGWEEEADDE
jgi:putative ATP-grasp target RiPP